MNDSDAESEITDVSVNTAMTKSQKKNLQRKRRAERLGLERQQMGLMSGTEVGGMPDAASDASRMPPPDAPTGPRLKRGSRRPSRIAEKEPDDVEMEM